MSLPYGLHILKVYIEYFLKFSLDYSKIGLLIYEEKLGGEIQNNLLNFTLCVGIHGAISFNCASSING